MPRVVVLGGGYAALAAVQSITSQAPHVRVTLIAPRKAHIKTSRLHETFRHSLRAYCVLYSDLARRFGFQFIQAKLRFSAESLIRWQERRYLMIDDRQVPFDLLVVATGARSTPSPGPAEALTLEDFFLDRGQTAVRTLCETPGPPVVITVVGGGATSIQFLFELAAYLKEDARRRCRLQLISFEPRLLSQFPAAFHDYAYKRLQQESIEWFPATEFIRQEENTVIARTRDGGAECRLFSALTLLFPGVRPTPVAVETNPFGQVVSHKGLLDRIFSAGDCAHFDGPGANTASAQVAVRKGKAVAANTLRLCSGNGDMTAYRYRERGYIVSLGPLDAIGWLGKEDRITRGLRASALKAAIERQYDLLLAGVDTYT
ncbi:MAG: FAD-dependent pyridine nucleotide-disulfide oxidoreductase [Proteobacteria bacterium]|nr:FAD-dependent pyridine nucleotide-disulfide oxidoreductase [Pseudomonadota bacterium]